MGKDYYAILGVPKTADEAELKKGTARHHYVALYAARSCLTKLLYAAYRKLAMKWHPVRAQATCTAACD